MSEGARVESLDALKAFKRALIKFQEIGNVALTDAESEITRMLIWLETEQRTHWKSELRKRQEAVTRAKEAVREKKIFKDSAGRTPSAVDEEKALAIAMRRLEEAEQKSQNVQRAIPRLQRAMQEYKGQVQRFATTIQADLPAACAQIENMLTTLAQYVELSPAAEVKSKPVE